MNGRFASWCTLVCVVVLTGGRWAEAQMQAPQGVGASTPLPLVVDLKKVPVGSWSEYRIADGRNTMLVRMSLVTRSKRSVDVESQIKGGPVAALGQTTMRMSVPLEDATEVKPTGQVIQLGDNPPMLLPSSLGGAHPQTFKKLDPKLRIGIEAVTVPGGSFPRAEHYREKGAGGETVDFWISKDVMPFGLIKAKSVAATGGVGVAMELAGHGSGAKPAITKTPQPFDAAVIMKQAQPAMVGQSAPAIAGPPLRPIPSPHPGMPPTPAGATPAPPPAPKATKE
jgi:hypothetical protein